MFFPNELPHGLSPKCNIDHHIDLLPRVAPINMPPYRSEEDDLSKQFKEILQMGYIRYSKSPWGAHVLLVKKKEHMVYVY